MKHGRVKALLLICLALLSVGFLAAMSDFSDLPPIDLYEVRDDAMIPGHVWIRLNPELVNHLDRLEHREWGFDKMTKFKQVKFETIKQGGGR